MDKNYSKLSQSFKKLRDVLFLNVHNINQRSLPLEYSFAINCELHKCQNSEINNRTKILASCQYNLTHNFMKVLPIQQLFISLLFLIHSQQETFDSSLFLIHLIHSFFHYSSLSLYSSGKKELEVSTSSLNLFSTAHTYHRLLRPVQFGPVNLTRRGKGMNKVQTNRHMYGKAGIT